MSNSNICFSATGNQEHKPEAYFDVTVYFPIKKGRLYYTLAEYLRGRSKVMALTYISFHIFTGL